MTHPCWRWWGSSRRAWRGCRKGPRPAASGRGTPAAPPPSSCPSLRRPGILTLASRPHCHRAKPKPARRTIPSTAQKRSKIRGTLGVRAGLDDADLWFDMYTEIIPGRWGWDKLQRWGNGRRPTDRGAKLARWNRRVGQEVRMDFF